jgi:hypothetical protein
MKTCSREKCSICIPFERSKYDEIIKDNKKFRSHIDATMTRFPELFPVEIARGYVMKDSRKSKNYRLEYGEYALKVKITVCAHRLSCLI